MSDTPDIMLPRGPLGGLRIAILHQGGPTPAINGVVKPFKPGGYIDSGADLAFNLRQAGQDVVTPVPSPQPNWDQDWSFPDTVAGIRSAVRDHGANVLWANTTLYAQHPIVQLAPELRDIRMVGQSPLDTEKFEDKQWTNAWLASHEELAASFPRSLLFRRGDDREALLAFPLPAVAKPIRGRGSYGVTKVTTSEEMNRAASNLLSESNAFLVEEYLNGEEVTITVMPPGEFSGIGKKTDYWCLPVVTRFNHVNGIAPYNGVVAVTANSRVVTQAEHDADPAYQEAQDRCQDVARLCQTTAPIRIDARRHSADGGPIVLFDVNMKPNATGPGRPGREAQASLVTLAAEAIGWDYRSLIVNIVKQAKPIDEVLRLP